MSCAILKLVQGTPAWHEHRANSRNASETPAVLGVSPWQTPYQLWLLRTGRAEQKVTYPMLRGTALEAAARAAYELHTGHVMEPLVLADGNYSASLDGITLAGDLVLEIKCPMKGPDSDLWKAVEAGQVPEYYAWQIEHQLMVSGARLAHLWVFDGEQGRLLEVLARPERWPEIRAAWDKFMKRIESDSPPSLSERDTRTREDVAWKEAAARYIAAKAQSEVSAAALDEAKVALMSLTSHPSETGYGVSVTQFWKRGAVDYKKVPVLKGVDLEVYRGAPRMETRVTVS
jgi:putative phage-type endonuclease